MRAIAFLIAVFAACGIVPDIPSPSDIPPVPDNPFEPPESFVQVDSDAPWFSITSVEPTRGPVSGGTRVKIRGSGFTQGSLVFFGGSAGHEVVVENESTIAATTPPHTPGFVPVSVQRPDGKWTRLEDAFLYETEVMVESVEPDAGPSAGGTPVVIRGRGFTKDSSLVIGGRLAMEVHINDETSIVALTPPGKKGPRDVLVFNSIGSGVKKRAFRYVDPPVISSCRPALIKGESEITVEGSGLLSTMTIRVSNGKATLTGQPEEEKLRFRLLPTEPGPIDVTVVTAGGEATLSPCLVFDEGPSTTMRLLALIPSYGPETGGFEVTAVTEGLQADYPVQVTVQMGNSQAEVLDVSPPLVSFRAPPQNPGAVTCTVSGPGGQDTAPFEYLPRIILEAISPKSGPVSGGTKVTVTGKNLDKIRELRIGPLPVLQLKVVSPDHIEAVTAPSSPGLQDVTAFSNKGERIVLPKAFVFGASEPDLLALSPTTGSQAGNTLVSLVGSGFEEGCTAFFGEVPAITVDASDPARMLVRSPASKPGQVDVTVRWPDGITRTLPRAYTYFDPTGYFGGVWGDQIDGAVNVTVLDSYNGKPIPLAFVVLGSDIATPYKGTTDLFGQITFSSEDLFGPVQVTASRNDYSTFTLTGMDGENLTLFLDPLIPTSSGGGGGQPTYLPPGTVTGRVIGVDKYILAPMASCADRPLIHGALCRPCETSSDCAPNGMCISTGSGTKYCTKPCGNDGDCPVGYACFGISGGSACLPAVGKPKVRCGTSDRGIFSTTLDPGPGAFVGPDNVFALNSRLGDVAVWCVGGFEREDGSFEPVVLGVQRHVQVQPATLTEGVDIQLSIPLDRELDVRLLNAPGGLDGPNIHVLLVVIDLGSDGLLRLWPTMQGYDQNHFVVRGLPRAFDGPLSDCTITFYAEANSDTPNTIPYSASVERGWLPSNGNLFLKVTDESVYAIAPDIRPDAVAGCTLPSQGGIILAPGGRTFSVDSTGLITAMPSLANRTLRSCKAREDGQVLAVGDDGTIVRWDGQQAVREYAPTSARLRGVAWANGGSAYAVGDGVLLHRSTDGKWTALDYGSKASLRAVVVSPDGLSAIVVGEKGIALVVRDKDVFRVSPNPTSEDLLAAALYGPAAIVTGAHGTAFLATFDGGFASLPTAVDADLRVVHVANLGKVIAAGSNGTFLRFDGTKWSVLSAPKINGEVTTLIQPDGETLFALSGDSVTIGPFLYPPRFTKPLKNLPWTDLELTWNRDKPPTPSLTYTHLSSNKSAGAWSILAEGSINHIALPDLKAVGLPGLSGQISVHSTHFLIDNFKPLSFDETVYWSTSWRSWTVEQFDILLMY